MPTELTAHLVRMAQTAPVPINWPWSQGSPALRVNGLPLWSDPRAQPGQLALRAPRERTAVLAPTVQMDPLAQTARTPINSRSLVASLAQRPSGWPRWSDLKALLARPVQQAQTALMAARARMELMEAVPTSSLSQVALSVPRPPGWHPSSARKAPPAQLALRVIKALQGQQGQRAHKAPQVLPARLVHKAQPVWASPQAALAVNISARQAALTTMPTGVIFQPLIFLTILQPGSLQVPLELMQRCHYSPACKLA